MTSPLDLSADGGVALVTGAGGFLGRHVARHLSQEGWRVFGIGHGELSDSEMESWGLAGWYGSEISVDSLMNGAENEGPPSLIFHGAGGASVGQSWGDPLFDFERTVSTTAIVIDFARQVTPNARLIYPSSAAVYGVEAEIPFCETAPLQPVSPYGSHKLQAERLCLDANREFGLRCGVIRFFSLFGPELRKQLLWDIVGRLRNGENVLKLDGDGDETRDFVYVDDASRLVAHVANAVGQEPLIVNGASGRPVTVRRVAEAVVNAMDLEDVVDVVFNRTRRKGDPRHQRANTERLRSLGFEAECSFESGVQRFVEWAVQQVEPRAKFRTRL